LRSNRSKVIAPANTGNARSNKKAVIKTDQTYKGILSINIPKQRILIIVTIKLMEPNNDEAPAKCKLKIAKSTAAPECASLLDKGG